MPSLLVHICSDLIVIWSDTLPSTIVFCSVARLNLKCLKPWAAKLEGNLEPTEVLVFMWNVKNSGSMDKLKPKEPITASERPFTRNTVLNSEGCVWR